MHFEALFTPVHTQLSKFLETIFGLKMNCAQEIRMTCSLNLACSTPKIWAETGNMRPRPRNHPQGMNFFYFNLGRHIMDWNLRPIFKSFNCSNGRQTRPTPCGTGPCEITWSSFLTIVGTMSQTSWVNRRQFPDLQQVVSSLIPF